MIKGCICLVVLIIFSPVFAQDGVGIGTKTPHNSSILHVYSSSNNKGVLFPNTAPAYLDGIKSTSEDGLIMFDSTSHNLVYFKNNRWNFITPWVTDEVTDSDAVDYISTAFNVGIRTSSTPAEALDVNGNIKATGDVSANKLNGLGVVPLGGIIMWSGASGTEPSGYVLCNGQTSNGYVTPNLLGRFIVAGSEGGAGGGSNTLST